MKRDNHYEAAFEAFLRARGIGFIAVDEARRSLLGNTEVKSLDFVVVGLDDAKLVIDVKGRKFPGGTKGKARRVWENWSTQADIDGLTRWAKHLGPGFRGVLVFVYEILPVVVLPIQTPDFFRFRNRDYLMRAIDVVDYSTHMRRRSVKWDTVHLPSSSFRECVRPFSEFLHACRDEHPAEKLSTREVWPSHPLIPT